MILIFLNVCISRLQLEYMKSTYNSNVLYYVLILIKILIGMVAGLEIFSKGLKKEGRLLFNIPRFLFLVEPLLFIAFLVYFYFFRIVKTVLFLKMINVGGTSEISQMLVGYFFITNFYKD